jgi:8-amino-3,8-dideoxy-alpha-D-manno-octulosonate transaminase
MDRRAFLAAAAAAPVAGIQGGTPLRPGFIGTQFYDAEEERELIDVVRDRSPFRWYGPGGKPPAKVLSFEMEFARRMGVRYALAVTSGTAALQVALAALEIGPGDEVILPAWTWHSCYSAIVLAGALPVFAEIDEAFGLDPADVEAKITPRTRAVLAVHLIGAACDLEPILATARLHRLRVVEDCAQALGATYRGRPVGSLGDIGIYSMQIHKVITSGEGGAVVTSDPAIFERAARSHDLGLLRSPHQQALGGARLDGFPAGQFRMSEFTGGVLRAQLRKLDAIAARLRQGARRVREGIRDLPGLRLRPTPDPEGDLGLAVYLGFADRPRRDRFLAAMATENVPASPPTGSVLLPTQPYVEQKRTVHPAWPSFTSEHGRAIRYGAECCPRSIAVLDRYAGVPIGPRYTPADLDDNVAAIRKSHTTVA